MAEADDARESEFSSILPESFAASPAGLRTGAIFFRDMEE